MNFYSRFVILAVFCTATRGLENFQDSKTNQKDSDVVDLQDNDVADLQDSDIDLQDNDVADLQDSDIDLQDNDVADLQDSDIDLQDNDVADLQDSVVVNLQDNDVADMQDSDIDLQDNDVADLQDSDIDLQDNDVADLQDSVVVNLQDNDVADLQDSDIDLQDNDVADLQDSDIDLQDNDVADLQDSDVVDLHNSDKFNKQGNYETKKGVEKRMKGLHGTGEIPNNGAALPDKGKREKRKGPIGIAFPSTNLNNPGKFLRSLRERAAEFKDTYDSEIPALKQLKIKKTKSDDFVTKIEAASVILCTLEQLYALIPGTKPFVMKMVRFHGPKYGVQSFDDFSTIRMAGSVMQVYRRDECTVTDVKPLPLSKLKSAVQHHVKNILIYLILAELEYKREIKRDI